MSSSCHQPADHRRLTGHAWASQWPTGSRRHCLDRVDPSSWESVAKIAGPAVTLLLSVLGLASGPERARRALKHDSEIVERLFSIKRGDAVMT